MNPSGAFAAGITKQYFFCEDTRPYEEGRMKSNETLSKGSRRTFLQLSAAATAAMAFRISTEASLAAEERNVFHPGAIVIDANENPLGPCDAARKAIVDMAPQGGRYSYWLKEEFVKTFTEMEGIKPEYLHVYPGSSEPLHFSVLSFTSPAKSYVTADPGYEAGMKAAKISGARIVKTPLTKTYAHDIMAIGRPDLLAKLENFSGWSAMPITAMAAATASLKHEHLVPERKQLNAAIRQKTFDWLASQGYSYVSSQSNCFMLDAKRPAKEVIDAMAARNVYIGRPWPVWPTHVRITVGTQPEMEAFQEAFQAVMKNSTTTGFAPALPRRRSYPDGQSWPSVSS